MHFSSRLALLAILSPAAFCQFDNEWARFASDPSRLQATGALGVDDTQEKDYAWGDLDRDGDTDLVVVRKQPFTTSGARENVLFMNEGGILVDRTMSFASTATVMGDSGFLTPTNDRDVRVVDVNGDDWLDVVTATTYSPGQPKHVSHPRVYINQGAGAMGNWLGLVYEEALIPQLVGATFPRFCSVSAGDVDSDGDMDLYFSDATGPGGGGDMNDRLLINDGAGSFTDETALRMTAAMSTSGFGHSSVIDDVNLDGHPDILKSNSFVSPSRIQVAYNDPTNQGFFDTLENAYTGSPYYVSTGDLNNDGRPDVVVSDNGIDKVRFNTGNNANGTVAWSANVNFSILGGSDDGFGSNSLVTDMDGDGWNDVLICDVDVDLPGCSRRLHIYHNPGGVIGSNITLIEEAQQAGGAGWQGVVGPTVPDLRGMHDVAVFDIDGDGRKDLVFGRCAGTSVWIQDPTTLGANYCGPAQPSSSGSPAFIVAIGSEVVADDDFSLSARNLPVGQFGYFLAGQTPGSFTPPGSQGVICLQGSIARFNQAANIIQGPVGTIAVDLQSIPLTPPVAVQAGETWRFQCWFRDSNPGPTSNFTDAVSVVFQ